MKQKRPKKSFTFTWAFEPFDQDSSFFEKRMFGGLAAYVRGQIVMVLVESSGERSYRGKSFQFDIWYGILLPTDRVYHEALMKEFPALIQHPVLGKWLYLPAAHDDFEMIANSLGNLVASYDHRLGVQPKL